MKHLKQHLLFVSFSLCVFSSFGQIEILLIEIETGFRAQELSWTLYDENDIKIADDGGQMVGSYDSYTTNIEIQKNNCYRFEIKDNFQDGIRFNQGTYQLSLDGRIIVLDGGDFKEIAEHYINCEHIGDTCETPIPVHTELITTTAQSRLWYSFCPPESAVYNINTCANFWRGLPVDTDIWVYDRCPRSLSDGPVGAIAYSASNGCAPAVKFDFLLLEKDKNYIIRLELKDSTYTRPLRLDVIKTNYTSSCADPVACNYNPFVENPTVSNCIYDDNCLPDLVVDEHTLKTSLKLAEMRNEDYCYIEEGCMSALGTRDLLRFTTAIKNEGTTDYIIGDPEENPAAFSYDNCHDHWHHTGYAEYLLYSEEGDPIPLGFKNGFCVLDLYCEDDEKLKYTCEYMGISTDCSDIYDNSLPCQWVDITDIHDGTYTLVVRVNWTKQPDIRGKEESNYDNNWGQVCFRLDRSSGSLRMEVVENCPVYVDCNETVRGTATRDCNGVCGGIGVYGDINENGRLTNEDLSRYFEKIVQSEFTASKCYDLNGDNRFSLYDAALLQACIYPEESTTASNNCLFPRGYSNTDQSVDFYLSPINYEVGYVDVSYYAPATKLLAFDLKITGLKISNVEGLAHDSWQIYWRGERLLATCLPEYSNGQSLINLPLVRVFFQRITQEEVCIERVYDVVNNRYEKIQSPSSGACQTVEVLSSTQEIEAQSTPFFYPNPTNSDIGIYILSDTEMEIITLFDLQGSVLKQWYIKSKSDYHLHLKDIEKGVYLLQSQIKNGTQSTQKIVLH